MWGERAPGEQGGRGIIAEGEADIRAGSARTRGCAPIAQAARFRAVRTLLTVIAAAERGAPVRRVAIVAPVGNAHAVR